MTAPQPTVTAPPAAAPGPGFPAGPRIYNLFPLLVGSVAAWRRELPRIAAMAFDWVYVNPFHAAGFSGSLYAIKDPAALDPRFRDEGTDGEEAIRGFVAEARGLGLRVMADLVVNHTSKDAPLAAEHPELYRHEDDGALASPFAVDPVDPTVRTVWGDLAELDWSGAEARAALLAYWDGYLARLQGLGIAGFRCDAAYKVPAAVWRDLIARAKARDPRAMFVAETLGCTLEETRAIASAGFDYLFNSFAWWDLQAPWALEQYETFRLVAPSIAFPESHDTERAAAALPAGDPAGVARHLRCRYAMAACFSAGVMMPIGFEWGFRRPLHVVETTPADREDTGVDISAFIAGINRLRAELPPLNVEGAEWRATPPSTPVMALVRLDAGHVAAANYATLVLANPGEREAAVDPGTLIAGAGGVFGSFADMTPGETARAFLPGSPLVLAPGEVRILAAARAEPREGRAPRREPRGEGRVMIEAVSPEIDGGRTPIKRVAGETVAVAATIFSDGHDVLGAQILYRGQDEPEWRRAPLSPGDNDRWSGRFGLDRNRRYLYTIEAWHDAFASWRSEIGKKIAAGRDVHLETIEGFALARGAAAIAEGADGASLAALVARLDAATPGSEAQRDLLLDPENAALVGAYAERRNVSRYDRVLEVIADRTAARSSAWYELFPRSQAGDGGRHGTFDDVIARLPYVRDMGFDVLYFPPIHPVGTTNRKGRNNALTATPDDVGSVYAIGSDAGGHDAIDPNLGTLDDFRRLVAAANAHGLEIALDFAIQCSPDHPWIKAHPEWFDWRPDGSLKYAENPPKTYEDIVNVDFYRGGLPGLWFALRDIVLFWIGQGVRIFRVDNPHTKPLPFWRWLIRAVNERHPDVIFLAEAFTRPAMMKALAKAGFQQSYTYFTWRNTKGEMTEYLNELAHTEMAEYYRPNFFVNTPDINPFYLQTSGRAGFVVRATLAATLSPAWGMYSGFELGEATPLPGREEYLDSEKYELKAWDWDRPGHLRAEIAMLNRIRAQNPALHDLRNLLFLNAWNDNILAYARIAPDKSNAVMVLVNLDPRNRQEADYEVPLWEFGLPDHASIEAEDLFGGAGRFAIHGKVNRIALDPAVRPVAIWRLIPPGGR
ncbi:MAG TPA: maltotransferase domain-containing protein [Hyphomicrobiales bacterium]|nr:maltotransferase domain-containing protein [Hyphomicrobiales bacterium]